LEYLADKLKISWRLRVYLSLHQATFARRVKKMFGSLSVAKHFPSKVFKFGDPTILPAKILL